MKNGSLDSIVRRWGFYCGNRLAFAGMACVSGERTLNLRVVEAEHHAHSATLPQRIGMEQRVRERVQADIDWTMGPGWQVTFRFEPCKLDVRTLAQEAFGMAISASGSGS
jgi:hypothetical protein